VTRACFHEQCAWRAAAAEGPPHRCTHAELADLFRRYGDVPRVDPAPLPVPQRTACHFVPPFMVHMPQSTINAHLRDADARRGALRWDDWSGSPQVSDPLAAAGGGAP